MSFFDDIKLWLSPNQTKIDSFGNVVYSNDNGGIEEKLDSIFNSLRQVGCSSEINLSDYICDIINQDNQNSKLFDNNFRWNYKMSIDGNIENHHFESFYGGRRNIIIDAKTTLLGEFLEFSVKCCCDISEYLVDRRGPMSNIGAAVIRISYTEEGDIVLEDRIYSLDLLNNSYSKAVLDNNYLGGNKSSFGIKKRQR